LAFDVEEEANRRKKKKKTRAERLPRLGEKKGRGTIRLTRPLGEEKKKKEKKLGICPRRKKGKTLGPREGEKGSKEGRGKSSSVNFTA